MELKERFKWLDRQRATELAIDLKHKEGVTSEEAVIKILNDYEGELYENRNLMTDRRYRNFIERVENEVMYKSTREKIVKHKQAKIQALQDEGELTELQAKTLDMVFEKLEGELAPLLTVEELAEALGEKETSINPVVSSLVRKGYLRVSEDKIEDKEVKHILIEDSKLGLYNDDQDTDADEAEEVEEETDAVKH